MTSVVLQVVATLKDVEKFYLAHKFQSKLLGRPQKSFYKNSVDGTFIFYSEPYGQWLKGGDENGLEAVDCNTVPICW